MTSYSGNSCLSLTTPSSVGKWVTKAFRSNLPSCTPMQGFWKDHLKPFCISLSLSNEKKSHSPSPTCWNWKGRCVLCPVGGRPSCTLLLPCLKMAPPRILLPQCPTVRLVACVLKHSSNPWKLPSRTYRTLHCRGPFFFLCDAKSSETGALKIMSMCRRTIPNGHAHLY